MAFVLYDAEARVFVGSAGPLHFDSEEQAYDHAARLNAQEGVRSDPREYAAVEVPS